MNEEGNPMKHGKALILALAVAVTAACASGGAAGPEAADDTGVRPRDTGGTRQAGVHLVQAGLSEGEEARSEYQSALTSALQGIQEMPTNPKAYLVAGQAAVGLQDWVQADTMFDRALEMYPGYQDQIQGERESGWATAYQAGAAALEEGRLEEARRAFEGALRLNEGPVETRVALGTVHAQLGNSEEAAGHYLAALENFGTMPEDLEEEQQAAWLQMRQSTALNATDLLAQAGDFERAAVVLEDYLAEYGETLEPSATRRLRTALAGFYAEAGDAERAAAINEEIRAGGGLTEMEYIQSGAVSFNTGNYGDAATSFGAAVDLNPVSHIGLLNLVQSLYQQAMELEQSGEGSDEELRDLYSRTVDAAERLRELDPLNRNLVSFMLRSYRALADLSEASRAEELNQRTQALFGSYQNQRFELMDIQVVPQGGQAQVAGALVNLNAEAGQSVGIRFELLNRSGQPIGSSVINVQAPAQGSAVQFNETVSFSGEYAGWRYSLVE